METTELMLGDIIRYHTQNIIGKVISLDTDNITTVSLNDLNDYCVGTADDFEGIPVTMDFLDANFTRNFDGSRHYYTSGWNIDEHRIYVYPDGNISFDHCYPLKTVHELQHILRIASGRIHMPEFKFK